MLFSDSGSVSNNCVVVDGVDDDVVDDVVVDVVQEEPLGSLVLFSDIGSVSNSCIAVDIVVDGVYDGVVDDVDVVQEEPLGSLVLQLNATDKDTGDNGLVYYGLDPDFRGMFNYFAVDPLTGNLTNRQRLDRERNAFFQVTTTNRFCLDSHTFSLSGFQSELFYVIFQNHLIY